MYFREVFMGQAEVAPVKSVPNNKLALGLWATFISYFTTMFFANSVNIAQPIQVADLDGMALFSWIIALPALGSAIATLVFGKLSDIFGRRSILLTSLGFFLTGSILSATTNTMAWAIASRVVLSFGQGALMPLCFSMIGDFFDSENRARWSGLLNIPAGIAATIAPTLGGLITESIFGWRGLYWVFVPLVLISGGLVAVGIPGRTDKAGQKVDLLGIALIVIASASLIIGASWMGDPAKLPLGIALIVGSIVIWAVFISVEKKALDPILDPQVLFNRTFITTAGAGLMAIFGLLGVVLYSPIFAQNVMGVSPTISGWMLTPFSVLFAFMGLPAGLLLAKTKKYKWIFISGYLVLSIAMLIMSRFTAETPIWLFMVITALAGFANGVIPTINNLVVQFAVPRRLLGVAIGALFFIVLLGMAISPAILGLAQNSGADLEAGLKSVFLVGAIGVMVSFFMILTIPEIPIDIEVKDERTPHEIASKK
jgi:MFS family permease